MLLNFKFSNFRSFRDETFFSMIPSAKKTHNEYLITKLQNETKPIKALPSAVIYGANASGKSNVILAMYIFKKIITFGDLDSNEIKPYLNGPANVLTPSIVFLIII